MKEHTGKNKIFIVIIICLCAVIIAGLIYFLKLKGGSDSAFKPDLDPNAKTQTADDTGEKPTGIRIPGYPSITIEADKKDVQMNLMNPEGNPCYFTFEIVLNDTDETIYTLKMVEPGKAITEVTLEKALAAGEYPATIKITTASLTDGSAMNGANVETTIIAHYGNIVVEQAQIEDGKCIQVSLLSDLNLKNSNNSKAVIPYQILAQDEAGSRPFTSAQYTKAGEETLLTIAMKKEDWKKAAAGEYADTVTFTISYVDKSE